MTKKALGKGLRAFIPADYGILKEERYMEMDLEQIKPNPLQPRMQFDERSIDELGRSMKETGVLQPIVVVPEGDSYKIVVGERRWRAAQKIGLKKIPVLVRHVPREQQLEISLIENLHREDLNPLEIALSYQKLMEELQYTQQEIADKVGKDRTSVTNYLRLLKLPEEVQEHLAAGKISMGHARALLSLDDPQQQDELARLVVQRSLTVREVEKMAARLKDKLPSPREIRADPDLTAFEEELLKLLGTKVTVSGNQDKGVIKIFYFSVDDLNRIYERIKGAKT